MKVQLRIDTFSAGALVRFHSKSGVISPQGWEPLDQYNEERHSIVLLSLKTRTVITVERQSKVLFVWSIVENEDYQGYLTVKELARAPQFQVYSGFGPDV